MEDPLASYTILDYKENGSFGLIVKAKHKHSKPDEFVAIKTIQQKFSIMHYSHLFKEIKALMLLNHENIVKFVEYFEHKCIHHICMEFVDGIDLITYMELRKCEPVDEDTTKHFAFQIAKALEHCHKNEVAHLDIKLDNIMVTPDKTIKLVDFGLCKVEDLDKPCKVGVGSKEYCSPQVMRYDKCGYLAKPADIYSFGVTLFCLLNGRMPFNIKIRKKQAKGEHYLPIFNKEVNIIPIFLIEKMLADDEMSRPTATEILNDIWFK